MIVKRGDPEYFELLYKTFSERLPVVWERRKKDRRRPAGSAADDERRRQERRGPPPLSWAGLGFVVVRSAATPQAPGRVVRRYI
jgi:hypothetical protein